MTAELFDYKTMYKLLEFGDFMFFGGDLNGERLSLPVNKDEYIYIPKYKTETLRGYISERNGFAQLYRKVLIKYNGLTDCILMVFKHESLTDEELMRLVENAIRENSLTI